MEPELVILKPDELYLKSEPVMQHMMKRLASNLQACLKQNDVSYDSIVKQRLSIFIYTDDPEEIIECVKNVFGISTLAGAVEVGSNMDTLKSVAEELASSIKKSNTFAVRASRVDKSYPLTSKEIEFEVGGHIQDKTGAKVDLSKPDLQINIDILGKNALIFTDVHKGFGGLPVGVSGKVAVIMEDESIEAAFMMLKRGCEVVPLHFRGDGANQQRFINACKKLEKLAYGSQIKSVSVPGEFDIKEAEKLAINSGCKALVLDCTSVPKELKKWKTAVKIPIFTPLVGL